MSKFLRNLYSILLIRWDYKSQLIDQADRDVKLEVQDEFNLDIGCILFDNRAHEVAFYTAAGQINEMSSGNYKLQSNA